MQRTDMAEFGHVTGISSLQMPASTLSVALLAVNVGKVAIPGFFQQSIMQSICML